MAPATSNDNHAPPAAAAIGRGSSGRGRGRSRASSRGVAVTIMPATVADNKTPYLGVFEFETETREPRERPVTVPEQIPPIVAVFKFIPRGSTKPVRIDKEVEKTTEDLEKSKRSNKDCITCDGHKFTHHKGNTFRCRPSVKDADTGESLACQSSVTF